MGRDFYPLLEVRKINVVVRAIKKAPRRGAFNIIYALMILYYLDYRIRVIYNCLICQAFLPIDSNKIKLFDQVGGMQNNVHRPIGVNGLESKLLPYRPTGDGHPITVAGLWLPTD